MFNQLSWWLIGLVLLLLLLLHPEGSADVPHFLLDGLELLVEVPNLRRLGNVHLKATPESEQLSEKHAY